MTRSLPRLDKGLAFTEQGGRPTLLAVLWWDRFAKRLEDLFAANDLLDATQQAALEALNTTTERANAAYELIGPGAYEIDSTQTLPEDCRTALVDATSAAVTVTLQPVDECLADVVVKKVDASANAVTIEGSGSETIDGAANQPLAAQYDSMTLRPAAGAWHIVASIS